jgi:hypothetical protein
VRFIRVNPDLFGVLDHEAQLRPLFVLRQHVALLGRGEAALQGERELAERDILRRFVDAALDAVLAL